MKLIQIAIEDRYKKELNFKNTLKSAQGPLLAFKDKIMKVRKDDYQTKLRNFINKVGADLQEKILEDAQNQLAHVESLRKTKEAEEKRKERDRQILEKQKAEGKYQEPEAQEGVWQKGGAKPQPIPERQQDTKKEEVFNRGAFGQSKPVAAPEEEKKGGENTDAPKRPMFKNSGKDKKSVEGTTNQQFLNRSEMGSSRTTGQESKTEPKSN